jgi:hypothetical protein
MFSVHFFVVSAFGCVWLLRKCGKTIVVVKGISTFELDGAPNITTWVS